MSRKLRLFLLIAPLALIGMTLFIAAGGWVVMSLWNWLVPDLFGLRTITIWQALGLLLLCRILFGGFGMGGGSRGDSGKRMSWGSEKMTPEERERYRKSWAGRWCGEPDPPDAPAPPKE